MGTYGTYTGVVRWYDPVTQTGHLLVLSNGELQTDITGDHWAAGATGYNEGSGFWLERQAGVVLIDAASNELLISATESLWSAYGVTRLFIGNAAGNKMTWDGTDLSLTGTIYAGAGDIGGWTINPTYLAKDTGTDATSVGMAPLSYPFYAGATYANRANATWRVTPAGKMYIEGTLYLSRAGGYSLIAGQGWVTEPTGDYGIFLGYGAGDGVSTNYVVATGYHAGFGATAVNLTAVGVGAGATTSGNNTIAIGHDTGAGSNSVHMIALGENAGLGCTGAPVIAIGPNSGLNNSYSKVILLGSSAVATANQQIVFGSSDVEYLDLYGGGGVAQAANSAPAFQINATGGSGSNATGGALKLAGGMSTGSAAGGSVIIRTSPAGLTGSSQNALVDRVTVDTAGNTKIGDGGATNYAQFDNTGNLTFVGTAQAWDDIRIEPVAKTTGANAPSFEKWYDDAAGTSRGVNLYSFDDAAGGSEKEVFFTLQMPHAWNSGDIHLHVHWIGAVADTTATPRWGLEYCWKEPGAVFGDTTIIYAVGNEQGDTDITANKHYITEFAALTPGSTADGLSSVLIGRLFRDSANAADTYNATGAKVGLLYIDAHFQIARIGSTDEYTP